MSTTLTQQIIERVNRLNADQQRKVLEFVRELERPRGVPAHSLLKFAGRIAREDVERMEQAMEDCERVDPDEW
jgi:hypothetical protein